MCSFNRWLSGTQRTNTLKTKETTRENPLCLSGTVHSYGAKLRQKTKLGVSQMHPELCSLVTMLKEASALFYEHDMNHWASWLEKDVRLIERSDFYGIEHLLSAYGGMGSINDVSLGEPDPENPGFMRKHPNDARLQVLVQDIHSLASKLSREQRGS